MSAAPNLYHPEDGWIHHATSRCPLPDSAEVRVQYRCGVISRYEYRAGQINWLQRNLPFDIKAYRIVSMPDGDA